MLALLILFLLVFALNVLPAFAPPTWLLLSFFGLRFPEASPWLVASAAASGAAAGRSVLASLAQGIAGSRWIPDSTRSNLTVVADAIERRRGTSVLAFLLFAFSPFPSNTLFLAYGLSRAPLPLLALPFFAGRYVSYIAAYTGGSVVAHRFDLTLSSRAALCYFVASQLASLGVVYVFTCVDWQRSRNERRLRWVR
ncbi:hypothetical protein [Pseudorhodoferax sp.]|uniref:hypothetical protein n=1 Tax=Pseudorhodoferax sp. TaxID=1993553 RepID=UPI0039E3207A